MITAKEAAKKALDYFFEINELVGLTREKFENLMIDEVDMDASSNWEITIGYELPISTTRQIVENPNSERHYRKFRVESDGTVTKMTIRIFAHEQ